MMRVCYTNRNHAYIHGGDSYKIGQYMTLMPSKGVDVGYTYTPHYTDLSRYDIIHNFHLGHAFSYKFHLEAKRLGKPVVLSPIFFPQMDNARPYRMEECEYAKAIAFLSEGEQNAVIADLSLQYDKEYVESVILDKSYFVPNGINQEMDKATEQLVHPNCPEEEYVVCVGRIDSRKNQHKLAQACFELDIPLVLIGDPMDHTIVNQVQAIASQWEGLAWFPSMPHDKVAQAYKGAKVAACPSTLEMWPNVVAEAGLAGCNLVISTGSMSFQGMQDAWYCDPTIESIKGAVQQAFNAPKHGNLVEHFRQYTWDRAANSLADIYGAVL